MNQINQRQNSANSIRLLAAQRQTYTSAKTLLGTYVILAIPLMFFVNIIKPVILDQFSIDLTEKIAAFALFLTFLDIFWLQNHVKFLQEKAATIQEEFDRYVYNLKWDSILLGEKVSDVFIEKMFKKYSESNDLSGLKNWYTPSVSQHHERKGILLCQNENLGWDIELRTSYIAYVVIFIIFYVISAIALAWHNGCQIDHFIMSYMIPSMPLLVYFRNAYAEHKKAIKDKADLKDNLSNALEVTNIKKKTVESIQHQIFGNRKSNPLIFDFFNYIKSRKLQRIVTDVTDSV